MERTVELVGFRPHLQCRGRSGFSPLSLFGQPMNAGPTSGYEGERTIECRVLFFLPHVKLLLVGIGWWESEIVGYPIDQQRLLRFPARSGCRAVYMRHHRSEALPLSDAGAL